MVDLTFTIEGAEVDRYAAAPTLLFKLRVVNGTPAVAVANVQLHCQIRVETTRRPYTSRDHEHLVELFGESHRWKETLQSLLWCHANVQVPAFTGQSTVALPVLCSFDLNVAITKYLFGLDEGEVPLAFLFSGTVFYRDSNGYLQMDAIPWSKEASYRLPVGVWQALMDFYYPDTAWLRIDREILDELYRYRRKHGFTGWDEALRALLTRQREETVP
jgi:hypothetical protein